MLRCDRLCGFSLDGFLSLCIGMMEDESIHAWDGGHFDSCCRYLDGAHGAF